MDNKEMIEKMARKYKEEMLKMYKQSGRYDECNTKIISPPKISQPQTEPIQKSAADSSAQAVCDMPSAPKFPSPDEIMREETSQIETAEENIPVFLEKNIPESNERPNFQGNYNSEEFSDLNDELEPRYKGETSASPDESGVGYIETEVKTGGGAVPVENAVVLITKKENGKNYLLKMLITDDSGTTETVALPAPNASFSETPDPSEKPFAYYYISAYADGFYAENDMEVPVFSGVKSIQPVMLIPRASDDSRFSLN